MRFMRCSLEIRFFFWRQQQKNIARLQLLSNHFLLLDLRGLLFILLLHFRCKCEFYYVAYGENSLEGVTDRIPKRPEVNPWSTGDKDNFVNAFSLIHHDLDVCTNSLQYNMILDVLNNLLLYIEPSFRSRAENYMRLKYQLMLSNLEDQRKPIVQLHAQIRQTVCQLRAKEKAIFAIQNDDR